MIEPLKAGERYCEWEVLSSSCNVIKKERQYYRCYWCKCSCGKIQEVERYSLISHRSRSCKKCSAFHKLYGYYPHGDETIEDCKSPRIDYRKPVFNKKQQKRIGSMFPERLPLMYPENEVNLIKALILFNVNEYNAAYQKWKPGRAKPAAIEQVERFFLNGPFEKLSRIVGQDALDAVRRKAVEKYGEK